MSNHTLQYTIRNVPPAFDARLKAQAKKQGVSLNTLILSKLGALPEKKEPKVYHDLDWFYGSMSVHEADQLWNDISTARQADRRRAQEEFDKSQTADHQTDRTNIKKPRQQ